ncbi:DMT family transporter [Picrophilus oshimae]|uniref:EamA-like transporter family protein n=1 Tax=Picrophilus torridus (strain ATCC 700027 / DSM 9790 / JCM 10055 / NBRC 100828 / KAW 2/3) TaxID=1122961 RepID=A0A8G2FXY4_PICTO|nr:DMT family transporter [Picrophilus oshimae]SMD31535.1 EamA-like transporter family protein [Picrophilus oshimae DSM 9789]
MKNPGYVYLIFLGIIWGLTYPLTKIIAVYISPIIITWTRIGIAALFFFLISRGYQYGKKEVINALLNVIAFMVFLNVGVSISSNPGLAAVMRYTQPLFVIIIEMILGIHVSFRYMAGILIGFAGIALSVTSARFDPGVLISLLGGISWAGGTVYFSRNLKSANNIKLNAFMNAFALPIVLAITPAYFYFKYSLYIILILLGILAQAVGFYLWFSSIKLLGPIKASAGSLIVPVFAYIMTFIILGIYPNMLEIIGSIITLAGVYITLSIK